MLTEAYSKMPDCWRIPPKANCLQIPRIRLPRATELVEKPSLDRSVVPNQVQNAKNRVLGVRTEIRDTREFFKKLELPRKM